MLCLQNNLPNARIVPISHIYVNGYSGRVRWNSTNTKNVQPPQSQDETNAETSIGNVPERTKVLEERQVSDVGASKTEVEETHPTEMKMDTAVSTELPQEEGISFSFDDEAEGALPWETNTTRKEKTFSKERIEKNPGDVVDPAKSELILAPLKKKSSPLQKLTPNKRSYDVKKKSSKDAHNMNLSVERDYKNLLQFKYVVSDDDFLNIIDELRPSSDIVSIKQLTELTQNLNKSFTQKQLRIYQQERCPEISVKVSSTKKKMISQLIADYWGLKITLDSTVDLQSSTRIDLSKKRDLFLLLSNRGFLPQHWSMIGAQLSLGKSRKELVVKGSKNIVDFVQASWNDILNNISKSTVELGDLMQFYDRLHKKLDLDTLQHQTGVHFDKVSIGGGDEESYVLSALKRSAINEVKIEMLKATEYRHGCNKSIINELVERAREEEKTRGGNELYKMEICDGSLPWYIDPAKYFRYSIAKTRVRESLLTDDNVLVSKLSNEVQDLKIEVEEARERFEYNYVQTQDDHESKKIFRSDKKFFHLDKPTANHGENRDIEIDHEAIEKELQSDEFKPNPKRLTLDSFVNVKVGKLLIDRTNEKNTHFDDNVPEVLRKLGSLQLMDKESHLFGSSGGILNKFTKQLYMRLIPNGFKNETFDRFLNYPSVEVLLDLKDDKLEVNKFSAFVCESEQNVEVGLPQTNYDLKFQRSHNSMLVYNKDQWILNGRKESEFQGEEKGDEENDVVKNKKQLNMFISQIGKLNLQLRTSEGLRAMIRQFKHKPYTLYFDLRGVKYSAVQVEHVRSIELEYEGLPVSFSLRNDGQHERAEVSMLRENTTNEDFARTSVKLAQLLSE